MIRTQISLTQEQAERLRTISKERGVSMAALIREAVDAVVSRDDPAARRRRALAYGGAFSSGLSDVSENHDRYLEEAFLDWRSS